MREFIINEVKFTQRDKITPRQYVEINKLLDKYLDNKLDIEQIGNNFMGAIMKVLRINPIELVDILIETEDKSIIKYDFIEQKFEMKDINEVTEHFFMNNDISSTLLSLAKIQATEKKTLKDKSKGG